MRTFPKRAEIPDSETMKINSDVIKMRSEGKDIIPLVAGEPDFNTPDLIKQRAIRALDENYTRYTPASGMLELRKRIVEKLKHENKLVYDENDIVVSCGAKQSISNALMALCEEGDSVLVPVPYWVSYKAMIEIAGATPVIIPMTEESGYKISQKDLEKYYKKNCKILILNSPANPTGVVYTKKELQTIADFCVKNNLYVISDEIYEKLLYDDLEHISIASLGPEIFKKTVVINGFSKSVAMTGWRIGYSAAPKEITDIVKKIQGHTTSHTSSISQYAACAAFELDPSYFENNKKVFKERRDLIAKELDTIPSLTYIYPHGAFYFFINISKLFGKNYRGRKIASDMDFYEILLNEAMVAVVPGKAFGDNRFIRISYSYSLESLKKAVQRIKSFIAELV